MSSPRVGSTEIIIRQMPPTSPFPIDLQCHSDGREESAANNYQPTAASLTNPHLSAIAAANTPCYNAKRNFVPFHP
jgi:hypothetical protein